MGLKLEDITGIGKTTAERMRSAGIDTVEKLATINVDQLLNINGIGRSTALKYIEIANQLLASLNTGKKESSNEGENKFKENSNHKQNINKKNRVPLKKVKSPNPMKFPKQAKVSSKTFKPRSKKNKKHETAKKPVRKAEKERREFKPVHDTFFPLEHMQRIRFLHFKIKDLEKSLKKHDITFDIDKLKEYRGYVKLLNVNYKTQSQIKIFKELKLTPDFYDPIEKRKIEIWDLMFECARVFWVFARAYAQLSTEYEEQNDIKNAIVAMVECSRAYKTASYFSRACIRQEDIGISLDPEELEFNSEEARVFAQNLAAMREENKNNYFKAAKKYSGLSMLTQRLLYLRKHDKKKNEQLKAQFNYDMGRACHLNAKALLRTAISSKIKGRIRELQEKANFYFYKAEELWEYMLEDLRDLSNEEKKSLEINLSIVNENIMENDVEIIDPEEALKIQDPEPAIMIPENLAHFLPRTTKYLTNYPTKNLEYRRIKKYKEFKLEAQLKIDRIQKLQNKKAGIGRTIKELKTLYKNNEIDINRFSALLEKYSTKYNMIESAITKLQSIYKEDKPETKGPKKQVLTH